jgi:hypothetical protein
VKSLRLIALISLALCLAQTSCVVPRLIWPQSDIARSDLNLPSSEKSVLVASRASEFKDAVVARLRQDLAAAPAYVKFIGLDDLEREDAAAYDAVVIMNTCMAWGLDPKVDGFLKRSKDRSNIVVLTTSGNGTWMPKAEGRGFDAIASASKKTDVDKIADTILEKLRILLAHD